MKPSYELLLTRRAAHNRAGDNKSLYLDHAVRGVSRRSTQWIRKAGFTLSKLCAVSGARLADKESNYWLAEAEEWARLRHSCKQGCVAQASHQDLRKKENEPASKKSPRALIRLDDVMESPKLAE